MISKEDFILIPEENILISKEEIFRDITWSQSHYKLSENGLFMPTPQLFFKHLLNVINAYKGKNRLYDGNNKILNKIEEGEILWYITSFEISEKTYGWCSTWLDSLFLEGSGYLNLDLETDHKIVNGNLIGKREALEFCFDSDDFCEMEFNCQGFPLYKKTGFYKHLKHISYRPPKKNAVTYYNVNPSKPSLLCDMNPDEHHGVIGTFGCMKADDNKPNS